ncbi:MAG: bifunctional phosphoribosylaminoimidazolecarboxamide formyltransferase/IMP cyclohydrolase [Spirochaetes bacterium]|nr:bifunctional phosphoribosylaminoimidazolecarboxamide formyltransferase/IMP cyclohydrolase [Spirochaetota bacterium]
MKEKYAIISVYDKEGIIGFAKSLVELGYKIISSSGTYKLLKENSIDVIEVSSITNFPEILEGRVKTLHPLIHGGILYRNKEDHLKQVSEIDIPNIEIVVVNLYPFEQTVSSTQDLEKIVENIDIGGPTLVRAGAKNFERVLVVVDKNDYNLVIEKLKNGGNNREFRLILASKAFNYIASYDSIIASFFNSLTSSQFPSETGIPIRKVLDLRYGENPHQNASAYTIPLKSHSNSILTSSILWGKELSYNNILDADVALDMIREFSNENFCCIIKHNTPCGASIGNTLLEAYKNAFECDPISAFGGIIGFSKSVSKEVSEEVVKTFYEVIVAPDYDEEALEILKTKKNLRIIKVGNLILCSQDVEIRSVNGGILVQSKDLSSEDISKCSILTERKPTNDELRDLDFAWRVVKFVKSNAIVLVKNLMAIGIGGGLTSRVDAVKIAIQKAKERNFCLIGSVCASDAFFPFKDSVEILAKEGITAIVQPGGSVRDNESIEEANRNNVAMVFTGVRHFKH